MPKISVIIPTYNRADFIQETIDSVLSQTYEDFEILVIDDGSTDNTREIVCKICDNRIRYFYQDNKGLPAVARNVGLREAKGEYIAFLDSDDVWFKKKLEIQIKILENNKKLLAVASNAEYLPKKYRNVMFLLWNIKPSFKNVIMGNKFIQSSVVVRREVVEKIGFLDENFDLRAVEDYDYWLRILKFRDKSILVLNKVLVKYRIHGNNLCSSGLDEFNKLMIVFDKYKSYNKKYMTRVLDYRRYHLDLFYKLKDLETGKLSLVKFLCDKDIFFPNKIKAIIKIIMRWVYDFRNKKNN